MVLGLPFAHIPSGFAEADWAGQRADSKDPFLATNTPRGLSGGSRHHDHHVGQLAGIFSGRELLLCLSLAEQQIVQQAAAC
jgi:hypothetical protein